MSKYPIKYLVNPIREYHRVHSRTAVLRSPECIWPLVDVVEVHKITAKGFKGREVGSKMEEPRMYLNDRSIQHEDLPSALVDVKRRLQTARQRVKAQLEVIDNLIMAVDEKLVAGDE